FFFFQAEDGIRDRTVTGVQTCALPICAPSLAIASRPPVAGGRDAIASDGALPQHVPESETRPKQRPAVGRELCARGDAAFHDRRSEERRVGKECRSGMETDAQKERG